MSNFHHQSLDSSSGSPFVCRQVSYLHHCPQKGSVLTRPHILFQSPVWPPEVLVRLLPSNQLHSQGKLTEFTYSCFSLSPDLNGVAQNSGFFTHPGGCCHCVTCSHSWACTVGQTWLCARNCLCEGKNKALICSIARSHGVSAPTMAKVKLPKLGRHEDKSWEEKHDQVLSSQ